MRSFALRLWAALYLLTALSAPVVATPRGYEVLASVASSSGFGIQPGAEVGIAGAIEWTYGRWMVRPNASIEHTPKIDAGGGFTAGIEVDGRYSLGRAFALGAVSYRHLDTPAYTKGAASIRIGAGVQWRGGWASIRYQPTDSSPNALEAWKIELRHRFRSGVVLGAAVTLIAGGHRTVLFFGWGGRQR